MSSTNLNIRTIRKPVNTAAVDFPDFVQNNSTGNKTPLFYRVPPWKKFSGIRDFVRQSSYFGRFLVPLWGHRRPRGGRSDSLRVSSAGRFATAHKPSQWLTLYPSDIACFSIAFHKSDGCVMHRLLGALTSENETVSVRSNPASRTQRRPVDDVFV